jgi:hypothetical protein
MAIFHYWPLWPVQYGLHGCLFKIQQKCRSTGKTVYKNMHLAKIYDQNKIFAQIMAISFVFWPNFSANLRDPKKCLDLHEIFWGSSL